MAARHRWTCPECGSGVLLGPRPRRDATARFCLPCSEDRGSLVERVCPALDRKRAERREKRSERVRAVRERQRARDTRAGVHVPSEFERVWRVAVAAEELPHIDSARPPPTLIVRRKSFGYSGRAYSNRVTSREATGRTVVLSISDTTSAACVRYLIAHEIAHFEQMNHSVDFWDALGALVEYAYPGVSVPPLIGSSYAKGQILIRALVMRREG
jgi:hypothetical protein